MDSVKIIFSKDGQAFQIHEFTANTSIKVVNQVMHSILGFLFNSKSNSKE